MVDIKIEKNCCGCEACVQGCPKHCISMYEDKEGFLYPKVNKTNCVDCGLCEKVCPVVNPNEIRKPIMVYAAKNKNDVVRQKSSSGGIFTLLAEKIIYEGGVVFGARFDENWDVVHAWTDTIEGLAPFRGSKYVQSRIGNTYKETKEFLQQGRKVLFSGTPCQIAGLKRFLCKEYDNLLTVDLICHGVPSPGVWRRYLSELRDSLRAERGDGKNSVPSSIDELPVITGISFRDKSNGWKKYGFCLRYAASEAAENTVSASAIKEEKEFLQPFPENPFMQGFMSNLYLRPSCYVCKSRSGKSGSDITIGDFWGIHNYAPEFDDDKGVGLILVNTEKGVSVYQNIDSLNVESTYEQGLQGNPCLKCSVKYTRYSRKFWTSFSTKGMTHVGNLYRLYLMQQRPSIVKRVYSKIKIIFKI